MSCSTQITGNLANCLNRFVQDCRYIAAVMDGQNCAGQNQTLPSLWLVSSPDHCNSELKLEGSNKYNNHIQLVTAVVHPWQVLNYSIILAKYHTFAQMVTKTSCASKAFFCDCKTNCKY